MDTTTGPKDYNSYRVSVNSKGNNSGDGDEGNIQNLNAKNSNINLNANNKRKNKRMSACEKDDLFKKQNYVKIG